MGHVAFEGRHDDEPGVADEKGRHVKGRTAVDMAHQTLTFVPQGQPLIVPPQDPLPENGFLR